MLASVGATGSAAAFHGLLAPVQALAADVKPVRIQCIDTFRIEIPANFDDQAIEHCRA
jgi:hypothetical protein